MNRRWLVALLVPALLLAAAIADRRTRRTRADSPPPVTAPSASTSSTVVAPEALQSQDAAAFMPVVTSPSALDSTWFCAAGTGTRGDAADAVVALSNVADHPVTATVNVLSDQAQPATKSVTVPARGLSEVRLGDVVQAAHVAAVVQVAGGRLGAELVASGPHDRSVTPCASRASSSWFFGVGSTDRGAGEQIAVVNPFPEDASVNFLLLTPDGVRQPVDLQGVSVPSNRVTVVDLGRYQARRETLSVALSASEGRVVATRLQEFDGSGPNGPTGEPLKGLAVSLGSPTLAPVWRFANGFTGPGTDERFVLYNPGTSDATVQMQISLDNPAKNGIVPPNTITVAAGQAQIVDVAKLRPVPAQVAHSVTIRSTNGVPITVDRQQITTSPNHNTGVSVSPGSPLLGTRWLLPWADTRNGDETIAVYNPGADPVHVSADAFAGGGRGGPVSGVVQVPPGQTARLSLAAKWPRKLQSVVVQASAPVVVDRNIAIAGTISEAPGLPFVDGAVTPH